MQSFKAHIITLLQKETSLPEISLEVPPNPDLGDFAFPCFSLSKQFKKAPQQIAQELALKIPADELISSIKPTGPYLNFFVNKKRLANETLQNALSQKDRYGSSATGKGKKILVEHTSINPNASPHVGRARNALIGDSIVRILRFQDYEVDVHYFVNDVGKQIAMLVLGTQGKGKIGFNDLLNLYIDINKRSESDENIEKQAFELLHRLEKGDPDVRSQFHGIVKTCIEGQGKILEELDIHYDSYDYESEFLWNKKTEEVLHLLDKTGKLFVDDNNRKVMNLEGYGLGMESPVFVMTRADGTSLYGLRDIAYTIEKMKQGENIVVLGEDQKLYFEQIAAVMKELRLTSPRAVHYSFVLLKEGKMSTRQGNVVLLSEFMHEIVSKANEEIESRYGKRDEEAAKAIGYGALKYSILKVSSEKSVTFDLEQALSFEGDTGPYIQYSYARIASILRKHAKEIPGYDAGLLETPIEQKIIKQIANFPALLQKASEDLHPHLIAVYLYELSQSFNEFYHAHEVLSAEEKVRDARLALCMAVSQVLKNGLGLLGIGVLERM